MSSSQAGTTNKVRRVLVTGSHRSGSTWVGKVLSQADELGYMHEPFNPIYPNVPSAPIDKWFLYISAHNHEAYHEYFSKILEWKYQALPRLRGIGNVFQAKMWLKYAALFARNRRQAKVPLMKDPIAFFSAPWLHKEFDMQVVSLVRHPAAFVYSLKRKDWHFPFKHLLEQEELMQDWLSEFTAEIEDFASNKKDIVEQASLFWCILYSTQLKFQERFTDWSFLKHEDLSRDPLKGFETLFGRLGLAYTSAIKEYVEQSSSTKNPGGTTGNEEQMKRDSAANIKYWKAKMSDEEIARVKDLTQSVWPSFYTEADW